MGHEGPGVTSATAQHVLLWIPVLTALSLFHYRQEGPEAEMENPNRLPHDRNVVDGERTSPSFMSTAWLVFKTFFASLLPEGPPAIAN